MIQAFFWLVHTNAQEETQGKKYYRTCKINVNQLNSIIVVCCFPLPRCSLKIVCQRYWNILKIWKNFFPFNLSQNCHFLFWKVLKVRMIIPLPLCFIDRKWSKSQNFLIKEFTQWLCSYTIFKIMILIKSLDWETQFYNGKKRWLMGY